MQYEQLIIRFQRQDPVAFKEVYTRYHKSMHGIIFSIVHDQELAEELMHDAFLKAWNMAHSYSDSKGRLFTWLLNISRNTAIDRTRSKAFKERKRNLSPSFFVDILESKEDSNTSFDTKRLKQAISQLKEKCIRVIELLFFRGYTQKEVASELNIPVNTVKTNSRRYVSQLRKIMLS